MQVLNLTDAQIDATYDHFENGAPKPDGVKLKSTFVKTMGRRWELGEDGLYAVPC